MPAKRSQAKAVIQSDTEYVYRFWAWLMLAWSFYRYFFRMPEGVDELLFKPLVFAVPVLWYVQNREHAGAGSIGLTKRNFWPSVGAGTGLGAVFAVEAIATNYLKYGGVTPQVITSTLGYGLPSLVVFSLATAVTEELLSRGFLFSRLYERSGKMLLSSVMSTLMFVAFHVPSLVTTLHYTGLTLILYLWTIFVIGIANCYLFAKYKSLVAPILVHLFWNLTVSLFL